MWKESLNTACLNPYSQKLKATASAPVNNVMRGSPIIWVTIR
ncbi:Uncharacterised protein [Vibrio cholerae]|nr:Uncharacterised protein [Vibrio cholerae]